MAQLPRKPILSTKQYKFFAEILGVMGKSRSLPWLLDMIDAYSACFIRDNDRFDEERFKNLILDIAANDHFINPLIPPDL